MSVVQNLFSLRAALKKSDLDAFILPSNDPHQSEYVAEHWLARTWLSGFDGSAGIAVVTAEQAGLWTDSRYFLQAETQLKDSPIDFHKQIPGKPNGHLAWLKTKLKAGQKLGVDGNLFSQSGLDNLTSFFKGTDIEIVYTEDPLAAAWQDRPLLPDHPIFEHDIAFAGKSRAEKLAEIRKEMAEKDAENHLVVTLDDIAWIFNLRGSDVESNPVFYAYALITKDKAYLFVGLNKLDEKLKSALAADGIEIFPYETIGKALQALKGSILLDPKTVSIALLDQLPDTVKQIEGPHPSTLLKAVKNATELKCLRACMEKDAQALVKLMMWLEKEMPIQPPTEHEVAMKLAGFRAEMPHYFGESFPAIAGYAGNGAIVHYHAMPTTSARLATKGVFLLDSGGQYFDGTTDITRTIALGPVSDAAILANTKVLKGHIALACAKFPKGTAGIQLDVLARMHLWDSQMDYGHGTGHGVGFFLNVHEGPQGISNAVNPRSKEQLVPGMIVSNEPGYYETGEFGIRIENLVLVVEMEKKGATPFYEFETLSLFPIDNALIDHDLLTEPEKAWLNNYHQVVWDRLSPQLDPAAQDWLRAKCFP